MHLVESPAPADLVVTDVLADHVTLVGGLQTVAGRTVAAELARAGAEILIATDDVDALEAGAPALADGCSVIAGDLGDPADCERIVALALDRHGQIDSLVNDFGDGQYAIREARMLTRACVDLGMRPAGGGLVASIATGRASVALRELTRDWAQRWMADGVSAVALSVEARRPALAVVSAQSGGSRSPAARASSLNDGDPVAGVVDPRTLSWLPALVASSLGRALSGRTLPLEGPAGLGA